MQTILLVVVVVLVLGVAFFFGGCFESLIVKECTTCGKSGKTLPICHLYESIAGDKPVSIFGYRTKYKKPWGVIHNMHLCYSCYDKFFEVLNA